MERTAPVQLKPFCLMARSFIPPAKPPVRPEGWVPACKRGKAAELPYSLGKNGGTFYIRVSKNGRFYRQYF